MLLTGFEPVYIAATDFKSVVSANSTTVAYFVCISLSSNLLYYDSLYFDKIQNEQNFISFSVNFV